MVMPMTDLNTTKTNKVQVELSSNLLTQLINSGLLHCSDCKCLNANAKQVLWQALLSSSASTLAEAKLCA